jgi:hypothetical protein
MQGPPGDAQSINYHLRWPEPNHFIPSGQWKNLNKWSRLRSINSEVANNATLDMQKSTMARVSFKRPLEAVAGTTRSRLAIAYSNITQQLGEQDDLFRRSLNAESVGALKDIADMVTFKLAFLIANSSYVDDSTGTERARLTLDELSMAKFLAGNQSGIQSSASAAYVD